MSATFSINQGQIIEATTKPDIFNALQELQDNTQKLITPRDVRDAIFTTWASSPFKITTPGLLGTEYIGIDSSNPSNRDIKSPILLGKRSYGNVDIMSNSLLLNNNSDIYFYNTKPDNSGDQNSTKIAILAGTYANLWYTSPYIGASASGTKIDLHLVNPSPQGGAINLTSTIGRVSINGVVFPTLQETAASASTGKILRYYGTYPNGYLRWEDQTFTYNVIGDPTSVTNIYGSTVNLNGFPLEFIDDSVVPFAIGGVPSGFSFSVNSFSNSVTGTYTNWPLSEVLRKIVYPYVEPVLTLSINNPLSGNTYSEVGVTASFVVTAAITLYARNEDEYISDFIISGTTYSQTSPTRLNTGFSFSGEPGATLSIIADGTTYSNTISTIPYEFAVSNTWISGIGVTALSYPSFFSQSVTASVSFIAPMLTQINYLDNSSLLNSAIDLYTSATSSRIIKNHPGVSNAISQNVTGTGYFYFGYPSVYNSLYGTISKIKDPNGFIMHDSTSLTYSGFTYSFNVLSSGTTYTNYTIFRTLLPCAYSGSGNFEFIF